MKIATLSNLMLSGLLAVSAVQADTVDDLLAEYKGQGAGTFNVSAGEALWRRRFQSADGVPRACTSCHAADLKRPGRHAVTGKTIEPLAPSVNAKRLSERRQIVKWFKRNCKWTLGRECGPQEKGDLLLFLSKQ